jgi:hypothetical protein
MSPHGRGSNRNVWIIALVKHADALPVYADILLTSCRRLTIKYFIHCPIQMYHTLNCIFDSIQGPLLSARHLIINVTYSV